MLANGNCCSCGDSRQNAQASPSGWQNRRYACLRVKGGGEGVRLRWLRLWPERQPDASVSPPVSSLLVQSRELLGRSVAHRAARRVQALAGREQRRRPKVGHLEWRVLGGGGEHDVLRFQVAMGNTIRV
eukprot:scaffold28757_cov101-Isochrysis_galbana.AAC.2